MIEKEIKVLEINKEDIEGKLHKLNAKKNFESYVETYYFDFKNRELEKKNSTLRVRKIEDKEAFIDLKTKLKDEKIKVSRETKIKLDSVNEYKKALTLLKSIGMQIKQKIRKKRTSYTLRNCYVEIDEMKGIPTYLEIEGREEDIKDVLKELGLEKHKIVSLDTFGLIKYYSKIKK